MDIEPDTGVPYTCFTCGNTGRILVPYLVRARHVNDDYAEYANWQNEIDASAMTEAEIAFDAWMTYQEQLHIEKHGLKDYE